MEVPPKLAKLDQVLSKKGSIRDSRVKDRVERMVDELRRGRVLGRGITLSLMVCPFASYGVHDARLIEPRSRYTNMVSSNKSEYAVRWFKD
jgi:hypothetical protein